MGLPKGYVYRGFKTAIVNPTPEQVAYFRGVSGACRWVYNLYVELKLKSIRNYKSVKGAPKPFSLYDFSNFFTVLRHCSCDPENDFTWLSEYERAACLNATHDAEEAFTMWLKGKGGRPKFKSRRGYQPHFRTDSLEVRRTRSGCRLPKVRYLKLRRSLPKCPQGMHYSTSCITYDKVKDKWYFSVSVPTKVKPKKSSGEVVGIDLGLISTAVTSYGKVYENVNDSNEKIKKLEHKKKILQRKAARLLEMNIDHYRKGPRGGRVPVYKKPVSECRNYQKALTRINSIQRKINGIRNNFTHQMTHEIVSRPETSMIVIENLNVSGMMKNHKKARRISEQRWYEIRSQLEYKSVEEGITLILADRFYPSSKNCSCCGYYYRDLKEGDRVYVCPKCGTVIDRDFNAAINLADYGLQLLPSYLRKVTPVDESITSRVASTSVKESSDESGRGNREISQRRTSRRKSSRIELYRVLRKNFLRGSSGRIKANYLRNLYQEVLR